MKKVIWLACIVSVLITLLVLTDSYALFETNATASSELTIGKWVIKVNNNDISLSETLTLNNFVYSTNSHTADGYFAPGRSAEFQIVIDTSLSEVSVEYELEIDDSPLDDYPNIYFSVEDVDAGTTTTTNSYNGVMLLSANNRTKTLKIHLNWDNVAQYDETDTSLIGEDLEFVINADFKQYLGT